MLLQAIKQELIDYFIEKGIEWKFENFSMVIAEYKNVLKTKYQLVVADAIQNYSYDGTVHDIENENFGWEYFRYWQ